MLKESRNTHVSRYRNLNPNKIFKHDSSLDDSVKFKEVKKINRMKNHAKNLKYRRSNYEIPNTNRNPILINEMHRVIRSIDIAVRFRENVLRSLGWMLQVPGKDVFSEEQYSGLHLIYTAVRENLVDFIRLTNPFIDYLRKEAQVGQQQNVEMLFKILSKNLPTYIKCTAHFIVRELYYKRIDIPAIIDRYKPSPCYFDYFTEVTQALLGLPHLNKIQLLDLIANPNTQDQWITYNSVGPIFLNIIKHLNEKIITLTQPLFVGFLICMPISPLDPSLEEHIFYLYKLGIKDNIPNWKAIDKTVPDKNAYNLIYTIAKRLLPVQDNNYKVIEALFYILNHLRMQPNTHMNPSIEDIKNVEEFKKESLIILLETMYFPVFSNDALEARNRLLYEIKKDSFDVKFIFSRMNRYRYDNIHDLLLAILTKWQQALKPSDTDMIQWVWIVKSNLILKKLLPPSPIENPGNIYHTDLLPPTAVKETSINIFINKPTSNKIIVLNRGLCFYPKQCLQNSQGINELPGSLLNIIQSLGVEKICSPQNSSSNNLCSSNNQPLPTCKPTTIMVEKQCPAPYCPPQECPPQVCPTQVCPTPECPPQVCPPQVCPPQVCPPLVCPAPTERPANCNGPNRVFIDTIGCIRIVDFENVTNPNELRQIKELIVFLLTQRYVDVVTIWNIHITKIIKPKDVYEILIIVKDIAGPRLDSYVWILIQVFEKALPNLHVTTGIKMIQDGRTVKQITIDLDNLLKYVLNFKELSLKEQQDYIAVIRYLDKNPTVLTRSNLDLFKYQTKGKLIRYIWTQLIENEEVDENIKQKLRTLLPRIRVDGSGAEKIQIKTLRTLAISDQ